MRFARLHRMLLDRQRRRLLTAEHTIHCRLRSLSFAQVLFWPLDTAHSLLRLNGIKTIGRLSSDRGNPREFWYVLLVFFAYLVIATATHKYRLRRAEAKAAASKEAKRQMADKCRRAKPWLAAPRQDPATDPASHSAKIAPGHRLPPVKRRHSCCI
ncbi:hypothetical protein DL89DRAFT_290595 [Linderina pennispora]|uniref:Uncharacterized protein n=1 Tax=Linderina pennispora TaxID=61395 RepID=A0A1Y1WGS3_9FUNG|nr:uncharacterized protein DL89DRAFT_290595 [Linderina pennispora]ORX72760.1 hypothetical protein DL89DRAFT_290595 [Linderina pennispora]